MMSGIWLYPKLLAVQIFWQNGRRPFFLEHASCKTHRDTAFPPFATKKNID